MRKALFSFLLLLPALTQAHPGHGTSTGNDWIHYLTSPGHLAPAVLSVTAIVLALMLRKSPKASRQVGQNNR
ncbi:MAG: hypothetical protein KBG02_01335 [Haliscomenobacter sp.]|nr:hypothetical protein [Haliscomenobacter sp.]MBK8655066.1 hypothetical protein [Haliscomenobacter sp.]MBP9075472.1 hypothetical protein [Haliscomenobacter sp.]MBP9872432.1 hypothetical protein [Haliscomenobacter sp.]